MYIFYTGYYTLNRLQYSVKITFIGTVKPKKLRDFIM